MLVDLEKLKKEYSQIEQKLSLPDILNDRARYKKLAKRYSYLKDLVELIQKEENLKKEKTQLKEMVAEEEAEQMKELAQSELEEINKKIENITKEIENKLFEANEPERDVIIEIRAAAGGEESSLFANDLFKMYSKYAEKNNWTIEVLSSNLTEIGGLKEIVFSVRGKKSFSRLKFESGVHRVQRVPATESGGRIHTSTVTVAVLIEPKEVELKISPDDLKIDTYRASGAGGQHVNVTDSAVRMTHVPTGVVVSCQDERSQIKNRAKALRVLKAKIMEKKMEEEASKVSKLRKTQVGSGQRSEKIRTYNFGEKRVTDHRINLTVYKLDQILEGNLDEVVNPLVKAERKKIYENKGLV
ncbi:MAG: peptide chain release factor 1 [Candidatus Omnitrophica bacterium]|nr:peptide chain release factor 1 [Candidatus Omnitrophota bacterium]